jgi:hypothetical protein
VIFGSQCTRTSKKIKMIKRIIMVLDVGLLHLNRKPKKLTSICSWGLLSGWEEFGLDIVSAFYCPAPLCPESRHKDKCVLYGSMGKVWAIFGQPALRPPCLNFPARLLHNVLIDSLRTRLRPCPIRTLCKAAELPPGRPTAPFPPAPVTATVEQAAAGGQQQYKAQR